MFGPMNAMNVLAKYADDTNLLVPSDSHLDLSTEFDNIKQWAMENRMVVNILKTKEVVFRRPNPRLDVCPVALVGVEQVVSAKLLGIVISQTLRFDIYVNGILKLCSQRIYLLKLLRDKGLPRHLLNTVFDAIVLSKLRYAISVHHGFLSAELKGQINAFLKRSFKYGFCTSVHTIDVIAEEADRSLFAKMAGSQHCLHTLLPDIKPHSCRLRPKGHAYKLSNLLISL